MPQTKDPSKVVTTTAWIILVPTRSGYSGTLVGIEMDRLLKTKPTKLGVRELAMQVRLEVDLQIFKTPEPEVTIRLDDKRAVVVPELEAVAQAEDSDEGPE